MVKGDENGEHGGNDDGEWWSKAGLRMVTGGEVKAKRKWREKIL